MSSVTRTSAQRVHNPKAMADHRHALLYSTKRLTQQCLKDIAMAIKSIDTHGSVEIYVQDATVTQITVRNIKKTNGYLPAHQ
jgi:hypothetical protein